MSDTRALGNLLNFLPNLGALFSWQEKLPVINWLLDSGDEALQSLPILQVIVADTDAPTELKAIHELVDLLHPVYRASPFNLDADAEKVIEARFVALGPNPGLAEIRTLVPAAAAGGRLKNIAEFLLEYSDEAVQVLLMLLTIFGRKPAAPKLTG